MQTGLIINTVGGGHNDLRFLRIPGVLQRFAISYCIVGLAEVALAKRKEPSQNGTVLYEPSSQNSNESYGIPIDQSWAYIFRDVFELTWHWLLVTTILFVHSCITFLMPLPNQCPKGYLGPGGLHDGGKYFNCTGGAAVIKNTRYDKDE